MLSLEFLWTPHKAQGLKHGRLGHYVIVSQAHVELIPQLLGHLTEPPVVVRFLQLTTMTQKQAVYRR